MRTRWSEEKTRNWWAQQPYFVGANFVPSTAINQLEMWQEETFDPDTIDRELGWAAGIGMNIMRVFLHDLLWEQDRDGFCRRIDRYLEIAALHAVKTMFVLFDDCWNQTFSLGKQPEPIPYTHNSGWVQSPGVKVVNDPSQWTRLKDYVQGILERFKNDERVVVWDLYNEAGNGTSGDHSDSKERQGERSLPLLRSVFEWSRSVKGVWQPLTVGVWNFSPAFEGLNGFSLENSDLITFHDYRPPQPLVNRIKELLEHRRPMICTEYMARGSGSSFEHCLPLLKKYDVGAINWGLVSGKSQTIYPWGWSKEMGEPDILFHDVFNRDGTFLYPPEEQAIRKLTGLG